MMKKRTLLSMAMVATMALATFTGCGGSREGAASTDTAAEPATQTEETAAAEETSATSEFPGFEEGATVGVSLPWLGTQNWKEAEEMFTAQLEEAGYKPIVQAADQKVTQQQQQIESMIENGAKVIVVGPVDGSQLGSVLEQAKEAGVYVIGYDRLLENTTGVDGVVQFGSVKTGELQAQALLDGLKEKKGEGPYNIELFGGGPADPNAPNFFKGAMSVLQPYIDDGTVTVVSGQVDFTECATVDWDNSKAQARMDTLLSGFYSDKEIDGVLCPNDGIARACITACENAGIPDVSYNGSTVKACPNTFIVSSRINWTPYFEYIIDCVENKKSIDTDWTGTIATGSVELTEVNEKAAAKDTQAKMDEVKKGLEDGSIKVFDTSKFTVTVDKEKNINAKATVDKNGVLTGYQADVDTDEAYAGDTEVIKDGAFSESEFRSAPYFDINIDGITLLNTKF